MVTLAKPLRRHSRHEFLLAMLGQLRYLTDMTKLTTEQVCDIQQHGNKPLPVVDPATNALYFLISSELFERLQPLLDEGPFDVTYTYAAQSEVAGRSGWDDPEMDIYDDYDAHKPTP